MMRKTIGCRVLLCAGCACLAAGVFAGSAAAERVKLLDGTEFDGRIASKDGTNVVVVMPRASVATVDGQPLPPPVVAGYPAPVFTVTDLAGATQTLGSASGDVTVINFWASWCPHCQHDVDLMKDLYTRYQGKGARFVMVSVDQKLDALNAFITEHQLPYPVIASGAALPNSPEARLPGLYESRGVPTYYVVDPKGVITKSMSGSLIEGKIDFEELLKGLIPPPPPEAAAPASKKKAKH